MTCERVLERLDDYLAGRVDPDERRRVGDHLAGCAECRDAADTAALLRDRVAGLPRSIEPSADLWQGIAPRLTRQSRRIAVPLWTAAAAVFLIVAATAVATIAVTRRPAGTQDGFAATEAGYVRAAVEMASLYERARDSLAPETRAVLERNLAVIERALTESREALAADPANRTLEALVEAAYRRKIAFLERATTLGRET